MMHTILLTGISPDIGALVLRALIGTFFLLARFRWVFDPAASSPWFNDKRKESLQNKLYQCGYGKDAFLAGFVAMAELFGGMAIIVGMFTFFATLGLLGVLLFATFCSAKAKVREQNPIDCIDCVSCYLWRVEGVYIAIAFALLMLGPGKYSLDYLMVYLEMVK